jgi:bacterioferritin (cytochrome b1)
LIIILQTGNISKTEYFDLKGAVTIKTVNELNTLLVGEHMAIQSYEYFFTQVENPDVKKTLQKIQQEHKLHAMKIAEQIQNLGGHPVNDIPMASELMLKLKSLHKKDLDSILKDAYTGEKRGIEAAKEITKGDLDSDSKKLIQNILQEDTQHLSLLEDLISQTKH